MKQAERTLKFKENYVRLHEEGWSHRQIAEEFDLSVRHGYYLLPEIAEEAGVSRESLLVRPHAPHIMGERRYAPVEPIDVEGFKDHFKTVKAEMGRICSEMETQLKTAEQMLEEDNL